MQVSVSRRLGLVALWIATGTAAAQGQSAPAAPPSAATGRPGAVATPADDVDWFSLGAVAVCRDGAFVHGRADVHICAEHGGLHKWLQGSDQDLIR
jgi:hypothetical protein